MRVFELAKELNLEKNKLIAMCKEAGLNIKSPLSPVDADSEKKIRSLVSSKAPKKDAPAQVAVSAPPRGRVIRSMKDLPSISSDDLERGKVRISGGRGGPSQGASGARQALPASGGVRGAAGTGAPSRSGDTRQAGTQPGGAQQGNIQQGGFRAGRPPFPGQAAQDESSRKRSAMTEFERQQAKIQKKKKLKEKQIQKERRVEEEARRELEASKVLHLGEAVSVAELASNIGVAANELIGKLFKMGIMATINQRLDNETVEILASDYGFNIENEISDELEQIEFGEEDSPEDLKPRDAIVTIMGHVDHGKTTLLDYIRSAQVAKGEAGGITQHIGAYKVATRSGHSICFLDTPGHEAFTAMRAHGSQITDVAVLVVAADDSVKPQTLEAINHARNAGVPIIVAITKIDKQGANLTKVYEDLGANGLIVEAWGGKIPSVPVSGISGEGIDDLLDTIAIQAEVLELTANPDKAARGVVVEAGMKKGKGSVATILVQEGKVVVGDVMVAGMAMGRARAMTNERGRKVKEAGPSTPVEIAGFSEVPQFADKFMIVPNEKIARSVIEKRQERFKRLKTSGAGSVVNLETLFAKVEEGKIEELKIIVKADVHGSVIALSESLSKIEMEGLRVNVIHSGVGAVSESDIMLASTANAIILCFHVRADAKVENLADEYSVEIRSYKIIYEAIEDIEKALKGMLKPVFEEQILGRAEVREVFSISKVGKIAGCFVESGKVVRGKECRLIRDGVEVFKGKIDGLNRFKDQVTEVLSGYECGILVKTNDLKIKDVIEAFEIQEIPR